MAPIAYQHALKQSDKGAVVEIEAPDGDISRIADFPNLTSLSLSGNHAVRDFAFLSALPKLQELFLTNMGITQIPAEVALLPELTTLFVGENSIKDFSILPKLTKLIDLSLAEMGLRKLPDAVTEIHGLKVLGLSHNSISSLTSLKKLKALEKLYAGSNKLKKLPKELAKLPLRELHIVQNYELADYNVLTELTELEVLSVGNSDDVRNTPAYIFDLKKLRELSIALTYTPESAEIEGIDKIANLAALEEVSLERSSLKSLPAGICELKYLRKLSLRNSEWLTSVDALHDLPALEDLDLTNCDIRELGDGFSTLKALKTLKLSHNANLQDVSGLRDLPALESLEFFSKLSSLPDSLGTLSALTTFKLSATAQDISFLAKLTKLEELYIANCSFDALPRELTQLRKLTVSRDKGGRDAYLGGYPQLEELEIMQPSFVLPVIPKLRSLSVGRIESEIDLTKLGGCPALEALSIHRSDNIKELPAELALAKGVKRASFEFLERVTNMSALAGLTQLEELELRYLDRLKVLPSELAGQATLRKITFQSLEKMKDLSVVGELPALESLDISDLDELKVLPDGLAQLAQLRSVKLRSCEKLKDISVLEKVVGLEEVSSEYCGSLKRKSIAAVESAIVGRQDHSFELQVSYKQFMESNTYKSLLGKEDLKRQYSFPLSFDMPKALLELVEDYSWLDDLRDDEDHPDSSIVSDADSDLKLLAILDFGWEGCDTSAIDSYSEEIFLVDTASIRNPVFIWGHDGSPVKIHDNFDDFLANLRDFVIDGGANDGESSGDVSSGHRTYLEYVDDKSSKFWQVVVTGSEHEVSYGKIGKDGSSKVKTFDSPQAANKDAEKLIASKRNKGYS